LGAGWGLCWTDCTVSMVSRYVCNMTKFKNNEQPGTILAPPRARPHRRRQPPYPVRSSVLSCTLVHPTASHFPPPGIPKRCPSLHPWSHTCQDSTPSPSPSPRTALQARHQRLLALHSTTVTTPPMWLARTSKAASNMRVLKCGAQETRVAHSHRAARVSPVHPATCPEITAKRIAKRSPWCAVASV